jgi:ketosteroid isomerase-like protein
MSKSVEVVRRVMDAINRMDVAAAVEPFSEKFELDFSNSRGPMSGIYRGRDDAEQFLASFAEPWASLEFSTEQASELEDGRLLTVHSVRARGDESGIDVTASGALIWTIREGEVAAVTMFQSKAEALEAAGLAR